MENLFVKRLNKKERDFIYEMIDDKKIGYRALIVALSYEGYPVSVIWKRTNLHPDTARKWIRRFNKYGPRGIITKEKRGRKPKIDKTLEKKIISIFKTKPKNLGLPFNTWSLRKLKAYLLKKKVIRKISHEQIRRILLSAGLSYQQNKLSLESDDPEYEAKIKRIKRLLKKPNCIVLFEDEKIIVAKRYPGYEWCLKSRLIRKNQRIKGKTIMFAAFQPHCHKIYRNYFNRLSKENFRKFLNYLDRKFTEDIYLILDNHKSHLLKEKPKKIKFAFLPTNSPKLNQMDSQFSLIQREVLQNSCFKTIEEVKDSIDKWIRAFNLKKTNKVVIM
jgi:transposase